MKKPVFYLQVAKTKNEARVGFLSFSKETNSKVTLYIELMVKMEIRIKSRVKSTQNDPIFDFSPKTPLKSPYLL